MNIRRVPQAYFFVLFLLAGYLFNTLVQDALAGRSVNFSLRFPAIEAFLPISALVGLKQFLATSVYDPIHPAGLSILMIALVSAAAFKKGLCSHICPIGTAHELLDGIRQRLMPKPRFIPQPLDWLLRLPKYLGLAFFIYVILFNMSGKDAAAFVLSPYNVICDAKMLTFFVNPTNNTIAFIVFLSFISIVIPFFWCRYLCPYGALLSVFATLSPLHINRSQERCYLAP